MDLIRIAFAGPGGSGKTTLAEKTSDLVRRPLLSSAMRSVMVDKKLSNLNDLTIEERSDIQELGLAKHKKNEHLATIINRGFVSDRTALDFYCYYLAFFGPGPRTEDYLRKALKPVCDDILYELVFFVPPFSENPAENDGVRFTDTHVEVEDRIREGMKHVIEATFNNSHTLVETSIDGRMSEISNVIESMCFNV